MKTAEETVEAIRQKHGLVCLVPKPEAKQHFISCHEKSLCDCQVEALLLEIIEAERARLQIAVDALEFYKVHAESGECCCDDDWEVIDDCHVAGKRARQALAEIRKH